MQIGQRAGNPESGIAEIDGSPRIIDGLAQVSLLFPGEHVEDRLRSENEVSRASKDVQLGRDAVCNRDPGRQHWTLLLDGRVNFHRYSRSELRDTGHTLEHCAAIDNDGPTGAVEVRAVCTGHVDQGATCIDGAHLPIQACCLAVGAACWRIGDGYGCDGKVGCDGKGWEAK